MERLRLAFGGDRVGHQGGREAEDHDCLAQRKQEEDGLPELGHLSQRERAENFEPGVIGVLRPDAPEHNQPEDEPQDERPPPPGDPHELEMRDRPSEHKASVSLSKILRGRARFSARSTAVALDPMRWGQPPSDRVGSIIS